MSFGRTAAEAATHHAREVMSQVGRESRYQTWGWIAIMILLGVILGAFGCYFFFQRDIDRIDGRLDSIQQQMTPSVPIKLQAFQERRRSVGSLNKRAS